MSLLRRHPWLLPVVSTGLFYALAYGLSASLFNVAIVTWRVPADLAALLLLSMLLFALSRRVSLFLVLQGLLIATLYVGSAAKSAITGRPLMPEDIHSLDAFIRLMGPVGWAVAGVPCFLILALFFGNLRFAGRLRQSVLATATGLFLSAGAGSIGLVGWMDQLWGDKPWDQRENYVWRGGTIHLLQELVRGVALASPAPDRETVAAAIQRRLAAAEPTALAPTTLAPTTLAGHRRNIHVVLEESFWDPAPLTAAGLKESPLDPRFLALWDQAGRSTAMSPAFGGQTANAEFEVLCGFPLAQGAVRFEQPLNDDLPCLPRQLAKAGYRTVASHPNTPGFWNRQASYDRLGFQTFWSIADFVQDDMTSIFLSDASLHRQVAEKLQASQDGRPVFDYTVTYYGHWMYDLDDKRPHAIDTMSAVEEVERYVSVVHWKSREMMDAIERWQRDDPDSVIVVFGDHLPLLGQNLAGYAESGFLGGPQDHVAPAVQARSTQTPLLVIDGKNGPLRLGALPMYRLASLLLDLVGEKSKGIADLATPPAGLALRPLPGHIVGFDAAGAPFLCQGADLTPPCDRVMSWHADTVLLAHDIFAGGKHATDPADLVTAAGR
ncbi:LTA synthase family protein [Dongia sp.]|uniref:LTA synthase family protein n=1 Tax=Dongia sp. TaxID=1977262 RepID=UPI0035B4C207